MNNVIHRPELHPNDLPAAALRPRLELWSMVRKPSSYAAPETMPQILVGNVYGHPRIADGKHVSTSGVTVFDLKARVASTRSGTIYYLGVPDPEYRAQFAAMFVEAEWFDGTALAIPSFYTPVSDEEISTELAQIKPIPVIDPSYSGAVTDRNRPRRFA